MLRELAGALQPEALRAALDEMEREAGILAIAVVETRAARQQP